MSKATKQAQIQRRRAVERLYREGYGPSDIVEMLADKFDSPCRSTIQGDIQAIRNKWREQVRELFGDDGTVSEWWIQLALSDRRDAIRSGNITLAYKIASDIAKLMGVDLKDLVIRFSLDDARAFVSRVCEIVVKYTDADAAEKIAAELEALDEG